MLALMPSNILWICIIFPCENEQKRNLLICYTRNIRKQLGFDLYDNQTNQINYIVKTVYGLEHALYGLRVISG